MKMQKGLAITILSVYFGYLIATTMGATVQIYPGNCQTSTGQPLTGYYQNVNITVTSDTPVSATGLAPYTMVSGKNYSVMFTFTPQNTTPLANSTAGVFKLSAIQVVTLTPLGGLLKLLNLLIQIFPSFPAMVEAPISSQTPISLLTPGQEVVVTVVFMLPVNASLLYQNMTSGLDAAVYNYGQKGLKGLFLDQSLNLVWCKQDAVIIL